MQKLLASDATLNDWFGRCVSVYGSSLAVSANFENSEAGVHYNEMTI